MRAVRPVIAVRPDDDLTALEASAARAGAALACAYSTSAEFNAAPIAERRAAGVYSPRCHRRRTLATVAGFAAALVILAAMIV